MMSMFDLKKSVSELAASNQGMQEAQYDQIAPQRSVAGSNNEFANGSINFRFSVGGQRWFCPSKSYIRMRVKISDGQGNVLVLDDDAAPAMGLAGNLFQSAEFNIADKTVSRCGDFVPQIEALNTRMSKSKAWLDSLGDSINYWEADPAKRQNRVASDGEGQVSESVKVDDHLALGLLDAETLAVDAAGEGFDYAGAVDLTTILRAGDVVSMTLTEGGDNRFRVASVTAANFKVDNAGVDLVAQIATVLSTVLPIRHRTLKADEHPVEGVELIWKPTCLSIFNVPHCLPAGDYNLQLNPHNATEYQRRAFESLTADQTIGIGAGDLKLEVVNMYLYAYTVVGPRVENDSYIIDLMETRCQAQDLGNSTGIQQRSFDISPSTAVVTVAYQDTRAGSNTLYSASRFKIGGDATEAELRLTRFYLQYAGQQKPNPDYDNLYDANTDRTLQAYYDSHSTSGLIHSAGGPESHKDWLKRGLFLSFSFPKDPDDRSTRLNVNQEFSPAPGANARVLVFDHFRRMVEVQIANGRVVNVRSIDD